TDRQVERARFEERAEVVSLEARFATDLQGAAVEGLFDRIAVDVEGLVRREPGGGLVGADRRRQRLPFFVPPDDRRADVEVLVFVTVPGGRRPQPMCREGAEGPFAVVVAGDEDPLGGG